MPNPTRVELDMNSETVTGTLGVVLTDANHAHLSSEGATRRLTFKGYEVYASVHVHCDDGVWTVRDGNATLHRGIFDNVPPTHHKAVLEAIMATALPFLCDEAARRLAEVKHHTIAHDRAHQDWLKAKEALDAATKVYGDTQSALNNAIDMALTTKGVTSTEVNDAADHPYR